MKRSTRLEVAQQTVAIAERGRYVAPAGHAVDIADAVRACVEGTRLYEPDELKRLRREALAGPNPGLATRIEVVNETTLEGIARLLAESPGAVAALNFASAKNPGGGFLKGSEAQEESLARSSALYASLLTAGDFYARHRASPSLLYSDAMILSPGCPVFRDDGGTLLDVPHRATFITSPAPNAGAAANSWRDEVEHIPEAFRRRGEYVLALAASRGYTRLVLGAWGCGVFRNDPEMVAGAFAGHLRGVWAGRFERVRFSVLDITEAGETFAAFARELGRPDAPEGAKP